MAECGEKRLFYGERASKVVYYGGINVLRRSLMFVTAVTDVCYGGVSICITALVFVQTGRHNYDVVNMHLQCTTT